MAGELGNEISGLLRTLRTIEQRYRTLRQKSSVSDQNFLDVQKQMRSELRALSGEITEMQNSFETMRYKLTILEKQLQQTAPLEDIEVLQKYIELWQPMNFVTKAEAQKMVKGPQSVAKA